MCMKGRFTILTLMMAMFIMLSCDNNDSFDDGRLSESQVPKAVLAEFEQKYTTRMPLPASPQTDRKPLPKTIRHGLNGARESGT
jgi:hypothetical protein